MFKFLQGKKKKTRTKRTKKKRKSLSEQRCFSFCIICTPFGDIQVSVLCKLGKLRRHQSPEEGQLVRSKPQVAFVFAV